MFLGTFNIITFLFEIVVLEFKINKTKNLKLTLFCPINVKKLELN